MVGVAGLLLAAIVFVQGPAVAAEGTCTISHTLRLGSRSVDVTCLEETLLANGYALVGPDRSFGSSTALAVRRWQRDHGHARTGVVDRGIAVARLRLDSRSAFAAIVERRVLGLTLLGREMIAVRYGTGNGMPVLAVAGIHGDETGSVLPSEWLGAMAVPEGIDLWVVSLANPDGAWVRRRTNAAGVDLNRNFDDGEWVEQSKGTERYSGPSVASEPETRALQAFIEDIRPVVAVWWHQAGNHVDDNTAVADLNLLATYAAAARIKVTLTPCRNLCVGSASDFVNRHVAGASSFVVELPRTVTTTIARRHAEAFLATAVAALA